MKRTVLITGSSGMLGKDLVDLFLSHSDDLVVGLDRSAGADLPGFSSRIIDLTDPIGLARALKEVAPQVIIHCAANVNVDSCEKDRSLAYKLHVEATSNLASYNPGKTRFVYISTDSVYSGDKGDYSEEDAAAPRNQYAQTKYEGERAALAANPTTLVLRTNLYGFHIPRHRSLVEWALGNWEHGRKINGFNDIYFNPLYTKQLARIINELVEKNEITGVINAGCDEKMSKYDFLLKLAKVLGYQADLVRSASVKAEKFDAARPHNTTMDLTKLRAICKEVPSLSAGLSELKADLQVQNTGERLK